MAQYKLELEELP